METQDNGTTPNRVETTDTPKPQQPILSTENIFAYVERRGIDLHREQTEGKARLAQLEEQVQRLRDQILRIEGAEVLANEMMNSLKPYTRQEKTEAKGV